MGYERSVIVPNPFVNLIVARSRNGVIGKDGKLPWRLPEDLKFFKAKTLGHHVVMGRHTWESIGQKALPERSNIVLTSNSDYKAKNAFVSFSLEDVLERLNSDETVFIIGGAELYKHALPYVKRAWITEIDADFEGDATFDALDENEWKLVWVEEHSKTEDRPFDFKFQCFERVM